MMLPLLREMLSSEPTGVILTTYALTPAFFEYKFVNPLLAAGCEHIVLFVDRHGYEAMVSERAALTRAGVDYWVVPVDLAPSVFHAKLSLLWSQNEVRMYVSSANLTKGGLSSNLEVVDRLTCHDGDTWAAPQIGEAIRLVKALVAKQPIGDLARSALNEIIGHCSVALGSLRGGAHVPSDGDRVHLLHNLDRSLLDQLGDVLFFEPEEISVVSPYFDSDLSAVSSLAVRFPHAHIVIAQGPGGTAVNPKAGAALPSRISPGTLRGAGKRFVHAKVLLAKGAEGAVLVSGSPNLTSAAWTRDASTGNFEAAIARLSPHPEAFDQLFTASTVRISPTKWKQLAYRPQKIAPRDAQPRIVWAELSGVHLRILLAGIEAEAVPFPADIEIGTREGPFKVESSGTLESCGEVLVVHAQVPAACLAAVESTASVAVRLSRNGSNSQFFWVKAIMIVPEDIGSPPAFKRARQAYNRIKQGDPESDDLIALLAFVQGEMAAVLSAAGRANPRWRGRGSESGGETSTREEDSVGPAVLLEDDESPDSSRPGLRQGGLMTLLDAVPGLFRALLRGSGPRTPIRNHEAASDTSELDEDQEPPSDDEPAPDDETLDSGAAAVKTEEVLEWIVDRFESEDARDSHMEAMTYLLDFGLSLARFYYLAWHPEADEKSLPARFYAAYVRRVLTAALSASGGLQGSPKGYFLRLAGTKQTQLRNCLKRQRLMGRLLYHLCELGTVDWDNQSQGLGDIRYILAGAEGVLGLHLETADDAILAAEELATDSANVFIPGITPDAMRAAVAGLRALETPEDVALRRFRPLLKLRAATRRCIDLKHEVGSLQAQRKTVFRPSARRHSKQDDERRLSILMDSIRSVESTLSQADSSGERYVRSALGSIRMRWCFTTAFTAARTGSSSSTCRTWTSLVVPVSGYVSPK